MYADRLPRVVKPSELMPGDTVTPAWNPERVSPFDAAIVQKVTETTVTLFRPYATTGGNELIYGTDPQVIPLVGSESWVLGRDRDEHVFTLWGRFGHLRTAR